MNQCKVCSKECSGNTCSGSCRAKLSRRTRTVETEAHAHEVDGRTQGHRQPHEEWMDAPTCAITASLQHYESNPDMYVPRAAGSTLNWGEWMDSADLKQHGLTGNRSALPGDWDYDGCCELIDGTWQVRE